MRTAKSCGSDAPTLASSFAVNARRRWQTSPVTGKSTKETVKTIARGMPGGTRCDRGDYARMLFYFACEAAGASRTRHSLRPHLFGAEDSCITRALRAAGMRRCVFNQARHSGARASANPESRDSPMRNCASEVWSFGPSRNDDKRPPVRWTMDCFACARNDVAPLHPSPICGEGGRPQAGRVGAVRESASFIAPTPASASRWPTLPTKAGGIRKSELGSTSRRKRGEVKTARVVARTASLFEN